MKGRQSTISTLTRPALGVGEDNSSGDRRMAARPVPCGTGGGELHPPTPSPLRLAVPEVWRGDQRAAIRGFGSGPAKLLLRQSTFAGRRVEPAISGESLQVVLSAAASAAAAAQPKDAECSSARKVTTARAVRTENVKVWIRARASSRAVEKGFKNRTQKIYWVTRTAISA